MGKWDRELIELLPESVKVYASAGAGFDWIDTACLADYGERIPKIRPLGCWSGEAWKSVPRDLLCFFPLDATLVSLGELIFLQEPCIFLSGLYLAAILIHACSHSSQRGRRMIEKLTKGPRPWDGHV